VSIESLKEHIKAGKRFHIDPEDQYGQTIIYDVLNTEPVCTIYSRYHLYAPKVILGALEEFEHLNKEMERTLRFLEANK